MDSGADVRWLSYEELAAVRGIDRDSAIRLARRHHWPKRTGNDKKIQLAIPAEILRDMAPRPQDIPADIREDVPGDILPDVSQDDTRTINALQDHVRTLREQLSGVTVAAAEREERLRLELAAARAEAAQGAAEALKAAVALAEAVTEVRALREALARERETVAEARRPFWRRWIG